MSKFCRASWDSEIHDDGWHMCRLGEGHGGNHVCICMATSPG